MNITPVVLSGGSGTRLWPLSREQYPKQLLNLVGEHSLLQQTILRLIEGAKNNTNPAIKIQNPIVVCNEQHRFLVAEQLRQINVQPSQILLEPIGRNTAPALTLAALYSQQDGDDDVLLVMPADHVIADLEQFHNAISKGCILANANALVTFGIVPDQAETGYGYIQAGTVVDEKESIDANTPRTIAAFVEKPDLATAEKYLSSGEYLWNSGMFMMKASVWLTQIKQHSAGIYEACVGSLKNGQSDLDFFRVDKPNFEVCPSDSIDYAVMEKMALMNMSQVKPGDSFGAVVPLNAGWSDVGAWSSLWDVSERDGSGNVCKGDVLTYDSSNSFIHAEHRLVASVGIDNLIVIETADAVMVADKSKAQDVKQIVNQLKSQNRDERVFHRQVYRPWGSYEGVVAGERFQVKRIEVSPGARLSLQMHHHRAEHWVVVRGTAKVTRGEETFLLSENESTYIPLGTVHRLENPGTLTLEIIEVQSGSYLGEDDIVRFEDNYGRNDTI